MSLEEQRASMMSRYKQLVLQRKAINDEISKTLNDGLAGKTVVIGHSRGEFKAVVRAAYTDGTVRVSNLAGGKVSTRPLFSIKAIVEPEDLD